MFVSHFVDESEKLRGVEELFDEGVLNVRRVDVELDDDEVMWRCDFLEDGEGVESAIGSRLDADVDVVIEGEDVLGDLAPDLRRQIYRVFERVDVCEFDASPHLEVFYKVLCGSSLTQVLPRTIERSAEVEEDDAPPLHHSKRSGVWQQVRTI